MHVSIMSASLRQPCSFMSTLPCGLVYRLLAVQERTAWSVCSRSRGSCSDVASVRRHCMAPGPCCKCSVIMQSLCMYAYMCDHRTRSDHGRLPAGLTGRPLVSDVRHASQRPTVPSLRQPTPRACVVWLVGAESAEPGGDQPVGHPLAGGRAARSGGQGAPGGCAAAAGLPGRPLRRHPGSGAGRQRELRGGLQPRGERPGRTALRTSDLKQRSSA